MKQTEELIPVVKKSIENLSENFAAFPWQNKEAYVNWLAQTYYFVRHTTTFLALVAAYYGPTRREDQYQTLKHLKEEMNHDLLALEDLRALGYDIKDFAELPQTAAFYQSQYYYIQFHGPTSLLGYSMVLEGIAASKAAEIHEKVQKVYGGKASRFVKSHSVADQAHIVEGFENLKRVSSDEAQIILKNIEQSVYLYNTLLETLIRNSAGSRQFKVAA